MSEEKKELKKELNLTVKEGLEETQELELTVSEAKIFIVNSAEDLESAVKMINKLKDYESKLDERYLPIKQKAHELHKLASKNVNDYKIPIKAAKDKINSAIREYNNRIERERRAEEERLRKEAEEKERAKVKADLEKCGFDEKEAKEEAEKTEVSVPEIKIKEEPKPAGLSCRTYWDFEITDVSKIPAKYMVPDEKKIRGVVIAMKENTEIPGIRVFSKQTPITR
jgi:chromatin assembly factor 1 subunit A